MKTEKFYTPDEAADYLKVSPKTIRAWLRLGKLQGLKVGAMWRIPEEALEAFLASTSQAS